MAKRLSVSDLEQFTTHELAELLANVVMVLRRLPDVAMKDLQPVEKPPMDADKIAEGVRHDQGTKQHTGNLPAWVESSEEE